MDLNEIKSIIEKEGGKIIVIENNKPLLMIMLYEDYKKFHGNNPSRFSLEEQRAKIPVSSVVQENKPRVEQELTIDDLPL